MKYGPNPKQIAKEMIGSSDRTLNMRCRPVVADGSSDSRLQVEMWCRLVIVDGSSDRTLDMRCIAVVADGSSDS